jgi:hypothetical protein
VISIQDPSIDQEATPEDVLTEYATAENLDTSRLKLRDDDVTWFELRPLNEHEVTMVGELGSGSSVDLTYLTARLGLVTVENYEGFEEQRETVSGIQALTKQCLEWVPKETIQWLALCIWKISKLEERQKKVSISRPPKEVKRAGTKKGNSTAEHAKAIQVSARN